LNDDGSTPEDNPFFAAGATIGGEIGLNLQQIFLYGIRNSFGMAIDPRSGALWYQENGEDAFDELNRAEPGMNSGWIQIAGPVSRISQYKEIETTSLHHDDFPNLQQLRWPPANIADSPGEALARLFMLPGARYKDPEFSWKHVIAPAAIGFVGGSALGPQFRGNLFVGLSVPEPEGGALLRLQLTGNRRKIAVDDPRLEDRVADNLTFHDLTESETLVIGRNFGIVTDIETGPNGNLFVVSLDQGTVYEIFRRR
jgi:glucose/arabinose dehydrogenase